MPGLIGRKIGMTSVFSADGKNVPCTVIEAGPCVVTQVKTNENDGYSAYQLAFGEAKEKNTTKPLMGIFKKAGTTPKKHLAEFKLTRSTTSATPSPLKSTTTRCSSTSQVLPKVKVSRASSNATDSEVLDNRHTVRTTAPANRVRSVLVLIPPKCSRECAWSGTWDVTGLRLRTSEC